SFSSCYSIRSPTRTSPTRQRRSMAIGKLPDSDDLADDGDEKSLFAEINITPLTDVFLVMVIIFMVSALAVQVEERQKQKKIVQQQQQIAEIEKKSGI